jgi:hypothetical protein
MHSTRTAGSGWIVAVVDIDHLPTLKHTVYRNVPECSVLVDPVSALCCLHQLSRGRIQTRTFLRLATATCAHPLLCKAAGTDRRIPNPLRGPCCLARTVLSFGAC